jgi:hypothetical protein
MIGRLGHVGTFQFGADKLERAGYVDGGKLAEARSDFKSEWAWAKTGGMSKFLENSENWNRNLSLELFRQSPELQFDAFKRNVERVHERAVADGVLKGDEKPSTVAGFYNVEDAMGYSHAKAVLQGGRVFRAPDGTSNYDCFHDLTRNRNGLDKYIAEYRLASQPVADKAGDAAAIPETMVSNPSHPKFAAYQGAFDALKTATVFDSEHKHINAAGFIAMESMRMTMTVHAVAENKNGDLFPTQDPGKAHERIFKVERAVAEAFPIAESTRQIDELSRKTTVAQDNPQQVRSLTV